MKMGITYSDHLIDIRANDITPEEEREIEMNENRCTCQPGRDYDGSEFGPCEFCERSHAQECKDREVVRDAMRWRLSQIEWGRLMDNSHGFFCGGNRWDGYWSGIQPHPITKKEAIDHCIIGKGKTKGEAIDKAISTLRGYADEGHVLPPDIQRVLELTP